MYKRLPDAAAAAPAVLLTIDGADFAARAGDTVAAALLAAGYDACRTTPVTGAPRGPFCLMGVCFDCLAVVDGLPNQQTCLIPVRAGMRIERQQGAAVFGPAAGSAQGPR